MRSAHDHSGQSASGIGPNPRRTLNRQDAKAIKILNFWSRNQETRRRLVGRQGCSSGTSFRPILPGLLGALAVQEFRIEVSSPLHGRPRQQSEPWRSRRPRNLGAGTGPLEDSFVPHRSRSGIPAAKLPRRQLASDALERGVVSVSTQRVITPVAAGRSNGWWTAQPSFPRIRCHKRRPALVLTTDPTQEAWKQLASREIPPAGYHRSRIPRLGTQTVNPA